MFREIDLTWLMLFVVPVLVVVVLIARARAARHPNPVMRAFLSFKYTAFAVGTVVFVLWLCIPHGTGYPQPEDIDSLADAVKYLNHADAALNRAIDILRWFMFVFLWWFLTSLYTFSKAIARPDAE